MSSSMAEITPAVSGSSSCLKLRCTACGQVLPETNIFAGADVICRCGFVLCNRDGILRALAPDRADYFRQFMTEYGEIRALEGRGAADAAYYLALPFEDRTGRNSWQWSIRAKTFQYFVSRLLPKIEGRAGRSLDVLDIGAGNGWLSYRLSLRGHHCAAVDLLDNDWDGLGAAHHYLSNLPTPFAVVQAEMDRLPFADSQFDLVLFNASFHYSTDYSQTVREGLRCLRPGGSLVVLDTPFYHRDSSGVAMVREREADFRRKYGYASNSIRSNEFITKASLDRLSREFSVHWRVLKPWYGWNWALRPWKARLRRRREPSKFYVLWGRPQP